MRRLALALAFTLTLGSGLLAQPPAPLTKTDQGARALPGGRY